MGISFQDESSDTEITLFLCYEALQDLPLREVTVTTPLADAACRKIATEIVVVPILRAGMGMLDGVLRLVPVARVGLMGLYRDETTRSVLAVELSLSMLLLPGGSNPCSLLPVR